MTTNSSVMSARLTLLLLLSALPMVASAMPIYIALPSGGILTLEVESSDTVQQVKYRVQDQQDISPQVQRLVFAGQLLEEGRTLSEYNIPSGATLQLYLPTAASIPSLGSYGIIALTALLAMLGLRASRMRRSIR